MLYLFLFFEKYAGQVNNSAHERCLDPVPLEVPIIDKLIQAKLAKSKEPAPS